MTTTYTNTNTNTNAPVAAADDDCCMAYATSADLCAPYITLEYSEARKERQEEERNEQRRAEWGDRLDNASLRVHKRARVAEKEEMDEAVRAAAKRARHMSPLAMWFEPALDLDVKQQRGWSSSAWTTCASARSSAGGRRSRSTGRSASQRGSSCPR